MFFYDAGDDHGNVLGSVEWQRGFDTEACCVCMCERRVSSVVKRSKIQLRRKLLLRLHHLQER